MKEVWKDIPEYEGYYQVSNLGNVKSLKVGKERIIKTGINGESGYFHVGLCKNGRQEMRTVHQLVAMTFLNHVPCGHKFVVNHKNFIRTDNRVENLEIVTQRQNTNKKHLKSTSNYTGVSWYKPSNKWVAKIEISAEIKHLGLFTNEYEAHLAYQTALKQLTLKQHIMKNVFLIPTDKPSRLSILNSGKLNFGAEFINSSNSKAQNIYITSNEEPKDGDWGIAIEGIWKNTIAKITGKPITDVWKKIILTTDPDLIKDGVQAIDDEFLEWFVKNPTCEWVDVEKSRYEGDAFVGNKFVYRIRLAKEVEDAAEHYAHNWFNMHDTNNYKSLRDGFIAGAEWQAKRMYSKKEVVSIHQDWELFFNKQDSFNGKDDLTFEEWFEKFKKK
jgi:hypothetical protein